MAVGARHEWERIVEHACVWEAAEGYGGARRRLAVGAAREWECIVVRAPSGKLRV